MRLRRGQSFSQELRERVLAAIDAGTAAQHAAERFGVSVAWVYKVVRRRRSTGETAARRRTDQGPKLAPHYDALRAEVHRRPDATLQELQRWLHEARGVSVSIGVLWATLQRLDLPLRGTRVRRPALARAA